ncbi:MAG: SurA N-terminal domain-containing protein [Gallionellaceae bacterium]|jgi:peptidyl-prolyl cis-trans isomerase D|nr:SurA N-terminal domain-containing protein [Gallionellaceae bacterium]
MFDFVHHNRKLIQIILALIILPFAFFGLESYRQSGADALATVNGDPISQQQFDQALRQQQDRMRTELGDQFEVSMLDDPQLKQAVLDRMINEQLLRQQANALGLTVSDAQLKQVIDGVGAFQVDGAFNLQVYVTQLKNQGMTPEVHQAQVREALAQEQLMDGYARNGYASATVLDGLIRLTKQQRKVSTALIGFNDYLKDAAVDEAAIKDYYEKNTAEFQLPERARMAYVTFSADDLASKVTVSDAEIKAYYDEHQSEFGSQEQRQVAHIMLEAPADASDADKQAARAEAERVLKLAQQSPDKFAELAAQYSQDTGSASNGGDFGTFSRGGMPNQSLEDAAFQLKPGAISGVVQSDFGYHILKILSVIPANIKPLAEVHDSIGQNLKQQKAADEFAELADQFTDRVFTQNASLQPAADLVSAPVQESGWLDKGKPGAAPWTDKVLQAAFSNDVIHGKRNSSAIEFSNNALIAVRLLEYQPAGARPFAEVSDGIRQKLMHQQALALATKQGTAILAELQQGGSPKVQWSAPQNIVYAQAMSQGELGHQVFQADAAKLPAYAGMENPQLGYLIARVEAVTEGTVDEAARKAYTQEMRELTGDEALRAYLTELRKSAKIEFKGFATAGEN